MTLMDIFIAHLWRLLGIAPRPGLSRRSSEASDVALLRLLLEVAEDLSQAPLDDILRSLIARLQAYYRADHACLHFVEPDELRDETVAAALVACPVGETGPTERQVMTPIEADLIQLAMSRG